MVTVHQIDTASIYQSRKDKEIESHLLEVEAVHILVLLRQTTQNGDGSLHHVSADLRGDAGYEDVLPGEGVQDGLQTLHTC